jgi:hypothetical protein
MSDSLKLPQPVTMPGIQNKLPYVFIGDESISLTTNFMTPYKQTSAIGYEEKCFNYRLSRARRVVENAFGIMANRFRVLLTPIATNIQIVDDIVYGVVFYTIFYAAKVLPTFSIMILTRKILQLETYW